MSVEIHKKEWSFIWLFIVQRCKWNLLDSNDGFNVNFQSFGNFQIKYCKLFFYRIFLVFINWRIIWYIFISTHSVFWAQHCVNKNSRKPSRSQNVIKRSLHCFSSCSATILLLILHIKQDGNWVYYYFITITIIIPFSSFIFIILYDKMKFCEVWLNKKYF